MVVPVAVVVPVTVTVVAVMIVTVVVTVTVVVAVTVAVIAVAVPMVERHEVAEDGHGVPPETCFTGGTAEREGWMAFCGTK
ncbi:hypothetical protein ACWGKQ_36865 [Streptomyces sp. NPDC054770]